MAPKVITNYIGFGGDNNDNGIGNDDGENDDDDYDGDDVDDDDDDDEEDHDYHDDHDQDDFNYNVLQDERSEPGYLNCKAHPGEKESNMLIMVS